MFKFISMCEILPMWVPVWVPVYLPGTVLLVLVKSEIGIIAIMNYRQSGTKCLTELIMRDTVAESAQRTLPEMDSGMQSDRWDAIASIIN